VGSQTTLLLHGVEVIKEALSRPEFLGRPPKGHRELITKNKLSMSGMLYQIMLCIRRE
ncbi:hypothetical protein JTE90_000195, partial [Oedothorax gibbosus]